MSDVGQVERETQKRVIALFRDQLGYEYLGNWSYRENNTNIETALLTQSLRSRGYNDTLIRGALEQLSKAAAVYSGHDLYEANRDVYDLLRYGAKVSPGVGEPHETVWLIDWKNPNTNNFAVAEEVTIHGKHTKRPDIVLYVNGIAIATLELKRSKVSVSEGIRQTISNQKPDFIRSFFSTVQFVFAGNDVEGLRYAVIKAPEKFWLQWKEPSDVANGLDRALLQMCNKHRLLELIHDFIVFDAGTKKCPRPNQYFGVKAAQDRIAKREGGIIWHTQGSGKSLTMVWLAKWIRENQPHGRVLLITDRTDLDEQIEKVFNGVNEQIYRAKSGADLLSTLNTSDRAVISSLIHKFGADKKSKKRGNDAAREFINALQAVIPKDFKAKGNLFVFVDEAHRTQSGDMHQAMKKLLPEAMFIGFTGTPLLKADKSTTLETFGSFIHTYKFNEAVADGVVLDLKYEARDIDQNLTSATNVDRWFDSKTKGMTDLSKAELKKRWGTMQKVVSSEPRAKQIVSDILLDMETKPRLMDGRGNAILVGSSIYQACKFYEIFVSAGFEGKCAIVTSYVPNTSDIAKEDSGEGKTEKIRQYDIYRRMLADYFEEPEDDAMKRVEEFEQAVKRQFVDNPGQMRLLIVVDKLLTGFDAPSATYLYIDKKMRDHGLFQAICRVNRLDDEDKEYGYIVDYQNLFKSIENAYGDYTSEALDGYDKNDVEDLLSNRIEQGRVQLDDALERIRALVEAVTPPKDTLQYQQYFCAVEPGNAEQIKANEAKRVELYKAVTAVSRAYHNIVNDMPEAGYSAADAEAINKEIAHYQDIRAEVKLGAGEDVDFKQYEAGMRLLLDNYIQAGASEVISDFEDIGLINLIGQLGAGAIDKLPKGIRKNPTSVAATISNNIRTVIVDQHDLNPKYYDKMSALLDAIIEQRRQDSIDYEEYLARLVDTAKQLANHESDAQYPEWANNGARRALVDFGWRDETTPMAVDNAILINKPHDWVGHKLKEKEVLSAIRNVLPEGFDRLDELFDLVKARDEYH